MGQAFRRATGRIGASSVDSATSKLSAKPIDHHKPPALPIDQFPTNDVTPGSGGASQVNEDNLLEDRNTKYDTMLNQMVGRIQAKPGGKPEMGEAAVVENYKRPLPKVRNTTYKSTRYEEKPAPPGTVNVTQLRQIILLYQGKADDHIGPMTVSQLAERFRIDAAQVQSIVKYVALPPEDPIKKETQ